jgi:hypothetical protein
MKAITEPKDARATILDILSQRPASAGNVARKMMGVGLIPKDERGYLIVREALASLLADGLVTKAGNGKSTHWRSLSSEPSGADKKEGGR